ELGAVGVARCAREQLESKKRALGLAPQEREAVEGLVLRVRQQVRAPAASAGSDFEDAAAAGITHSSRSCEELAQHGGRSGLALPAVATRVHARVETMQSTEEAVDAGGYEPRFVC